MSYQICFLFASIDIDFFQTAGFIFNKIEVFVPYSKSLIKSNLKRVAIMRWTCDEYKSVDLCLTWCLEKLIFYYYFSSPRQTSSRLRDDSLKTRPPPPPLIIPIGSHLAYLKKGMKTKKLTFWCHRKRVTHNLCILYDTKTGTDLHEHVIDIIFLKHVLLIAFWTWA